MDLAVAQADKLQHTERALSQFFLGFLLKGTRGQIHFFLHDFSHRVNLGGQHLLLHTQSLVQWNISHVPTVMYRIKDFRFSTQI